MRFGASAIAATARRLAIKAWRRKPRSQGIFDVTFADSAMAEFIQRGGFFLMSVFLLDKVKMTLQSGMSLADCSYFLKSCDGSQSDCGARIARRPYGFRA